ncbi:hypothetical protein HDZ31DRAFT_64552 [Schizophyllum fasciatum]
MDSPVQHRRAANLHNRIAKVGRGVAQLSGEGLVKRQRGIFGSDDDDDDDDGGDIFESIFGGHNPAGTTSETTAAATTRAAVTTTAATQPTTAAETTRQLTTAAETTRQTTAAAATTTAQTTTSQTSSRQPVTTSATSTSTSATSTSTTSRATTTSSSSTTSSTTRQPTTSHVTTTLADPTTSSRSTAFVTQSSSIAGSSAANAAASSTKEASGATSSNAGSIAGGVIGGIVGVVALFFLASWFIRRRRRQADEDEWNKQFNDGFNPGNFRKSAVMLPPDSNNGSMFNPRPPTMIERKMSPPAAAYSPYNNAAPVSFNPGAHNAYPSESYSAAGGYNGNENYGAYGQEDQYAQYQQYNNYSAYPAYNNAALSSANPFMDQNAVAYSPSMSPPPVNGNYNVVYNERGEPVMQQALTRQPSNGTILTHRSTEMERQQSITSASAIGVARSTSQITQVAPPSERVASPPVARQASLPPLPVPQAMPVAQPAAPAEPVAELGPAAAAEPEHAASIKPGELMVSPFADVTHDAKEARMSSMSNSSLGQFPQPPSDLVPPMGSRYKIDSMPPMLPDMQFNSHESALPGQDYPSSIHNSMSSFMSPVGNEPRPSPLAKSTVPEPASPPPPVVAKDAPAAHEPAAPVAVAPAVAAPATTSPSPRASANQPKQERPPTVYDEADAYGGI